MSKTAVIYDRWLHVIGGAEVVACTMARTLKDAGWDVTLVSGKGVKHKDIERKTGIKVSDIPIRINWDDEIRMREFTEDKDLFVNVTFMDYTIGYAKKNMYYTHFPTPAHDSLKGRIFNNLVLPFTGYVYRPYEFTEGEHITTVNHRFGSLVKDSCTLTFYHLRPKKKYVLRFALFIENFYSSYIENLSVEVLGAKVLSKKIHTDPHHNVLHFSYNVISQSNSVSVKVTEPEVSTKRHLKPDDRLFIIIPRIISSMRPYRFFSAFSERIRNRLRAGVFINVLKRLSTYEIILANSTFTQFWINKFWHRSSEVLYPPVHLLGDSHSISVNRKKWICSVGRFFTKGHGKRQEILIEAFKKLYDMGFKDYELHLIGGIGNSNEDIALANSLENMAENYPIHFHFNAPRKKLLQIVTQSQFYWMATGYGKEESHVPIEFEHFGISAVEAMSGGCIPILYNGGGLKEIVKSLENGKGELFNSIDELVEKTVKHIEEDSTIDVKALTKELKEKYSAEAFAQHFLKLVS